MSTVILGPLEVEKVRYAIGGHDSTISCHEIPRKILRITHQAIVRSVKKAPAKTEVSEPAISCTRSL